MSIIFIFFLGVLFAFSLSIFFGSPFLRTHKKPIESAMDLLELKKGDRFVDLGSGDGSVLIAAAKRGATVEGYELNPILWLVSLVRTRKYRSQITIHWGDMWQVDLTKFNKMFVFLDSRFLPKLVRKISSSDKKILVASYSYKFADQPIITTKDGIHLYQFND